MKAVIEFDLDNFDDRQAHARCVKALDMTLALFELQYSLRKEIEKDLDKDGITRYGAADLVFNGITRIMEEHNVNLDELVS